MLRQRTIACGRERYVFPENVKPDTWKWFSALANHLLIVF